jgi:hypothetical protein
VGHKRNVNYIMSYYFFIPGKYHPPPSISPYLIELYDHNPKVIMVEVAWITNNMDRVGEIHLINPLCILILGS